MKKENIEDDDIAMIEMWQGQKQSPKDNTIDKKCVPSGLYSKDNNKQIHFYCQFCDKEMGYEEDRICSALSDNTIDKRGTDNSANVPITNGYMKPVDTIDKIKEEEFTFTFSEWNEALKKADELMKASNGHSFMTILKTRCQNCGRSPKQSGVCRNWQITLIDKLLFVLMNKDKYLSTLKDK